MGVEVYRHLKRFLQLRHKGVDAGGVHKSCHILHCHHLRTEFLHLKCLVDKVFVGEDLLVLRCALRVDCVAYCCVGYTSKLVDHRDGPLDVVDVVEGIEDSHHVQSILDGFLVEAFQYAVGIWHVAEEVTPSREG